MAKLDGHVAAITGAAGGIGHAIAKRFAAEGAAVALLDLDLDGATRIATELAETGARAMATKIDVTDEHSVDVAFKEVALSIGAADILVNSAAIADGAPIAEMQTDMWDRMFAINLRGTFLCCRAALPGMQEKGWGRIVNMASEVAMRGHPGLSHYAASKAGVIAMTKCLALEVAGDNIRANVVAPGPTDTSMLSEIDEETLANLISELMPIGRLGKPEEIAAAALYLASDDADFCIGTTLNINGGTYRQ